ncbi:hypothetical protein [Streptomyces umbrinus]|uniref:hypothetical protein n=1 Tax=Streptomyces umbrinus TaxID=67370 RepID=UPI0033D5C9F3
MQSKFEQRLQPVTAGGGQKLACFLRGEGFEAAGAGRAVAGDVVRDLLLADGVLQGGLEYGVDVGQGQR